MLRQLKTISVLLAIALMAKYQNLELSHIDALVLYWLIDIRGRV
jgi:hypothetical protein